MDPHHRLQRLAQRLRLAKRGANEKDYAIATDLERLGVHGLVRVEQMLRARVSQIGVNLVDALHERAVQLCVEVRKGCHGGVGAANGVF